MSIGNMALTRRALFGVLITLAAPFFYEWMLGSHWSVNLQMLPAKLGLGSTTYVGLQVVLIVMALSSLAGAITISSLCLISRMQPRWAALLAGLSVLLISESYELSQLILGGATGHDIAAVVLVALYVLVGWSSAKLVLRRSEFELQAKK